jgi:hypothetical protein
MQRRWRVAVVVLDLRLILRVRVMRWCCTLPPEWPLTLSPTLIEGMRGLAIEAERHAPPSPLLARPGRAKGRLSSSFSNLTSSVPLKRLTNSTISQHHLLHTLALLLLAI